ncbi:alpha-ketoglutarate-dependent dioxygenase AlkB family protein [Flavobacterium ardleyense]|uniref:alpha-ketoglutarate-dependent dioxygenase AlkB family protein n=1 Tax=Flavobacterium ardleyense TaxID=2038737 RepID=UPI00298CFEC5|nr:alpha-ketoglutarate-dependent dioxygenase AlkB [Flavobacterium ardleyense]
MLLFEETYDSNKNYLPHGGTVNFYGKIFNQQSADFYYGALLETIRWQNDEALIFGKKIITKRKVAWYGDEAFSYTYSNNTKTALPWTDELVTIKQIVEEKSGETFNSCLLNLYHSGEEGMAWHSDAEKDLAKEGAIASVSFGAERKFCFKHKESSEKIELLLPHGSLLIMKGETQKNWLHRLPPTKKISNSRVNLTFRTIVGK